MDKKFFETAFSEKRLEKYFQQHTDTTKAIAHYQYNIELAESFYASFSVLEVLLRNSVSRELERLFGRDDWYTSFVTIPALAGLDKYIVQAYLQISARKESITPSKVIAELTLGFWVTLFNVEYERILWKHLRKAFPNMPKKERQRKKVAPPLNRFRTFRNRVFHHESVSWNMNRLKQIHSEIVNTINWMNSDITVWLSGFDRFNDNWNDIYSKRIIN